MSSWGEKEIKVLNSRIIGATKGSKVGHSSLSHDWPTGCVTKVPVEKRFVVVVVIEIARL